MKNVFGTQEELKLYNKNSICVYAFYKNLQGLFNESIYDKNGRLLTHKRSDGYWSKFTRDENGNELTYENSDGLKSGFVTPKVTIEEFVEFMEKTIEDFNKLIGKK